METPRTEESHKILQIIKDPSSESSAFIMQVCCSASNSLDHGHLYCEKNNINSI